MFYYMKGKDERLNFVVFDRFMRNFEMKSEEIQNLADKHPDQFDSYLKFKKKIFEHDKDDHAVDLFDNQ